MWRYFIACLLCSLSSIENSFSLCMKIKIHELCHTYSQLLGIDTVHVRVFIVLCNIKQFVLFRRGKRIKKATHSMLFLRKKRLHAGKKQNAAKKKKEDNFCKCNAGQPQVPGGGERFPE